MKTQPIIANPYLHYLKNNAGLRAQPTLKV